MLIKHKNIRLILIITLVVICVFGIGFVIINKHLYKIDNNKENNDVVNTTRVKDIGLTNGYIDVNNDIIKKLFNYFREDKNCLDEYNNIDDNKTKLVIAFNNIYESKSSFYKCKDINKLTINDKYFCGKNINDYDYDTYKIGINSTSFLNIIQKNNTIIISGSDIDNAIHNIFGSTAGYINESFLFGNDSYINYDNNTGKYVMYKYYNNKVCKNYKEEIVSAYSNNGVLEVRMQLYDDNIVIKNTLLTFNFNTDTGEYIISKKSIY